MKRTVFRACAGLLIAGMICASVFADQGSIREEVQVLFDKAGAAFDRKDADGVVEIATKDAALEYLDGTILSVDEWRAKAQGEFNDTIGMRSQFMVQTARSAGDTANATYTEIHNYNLLSDPGHRYRSTSRWNVVLIRTPEGWRGAHFEQLLEDVTRDGMPLPAGAAKPRF